MANIARSNLSASMLPEQYLRPIIQEAQKSSTLMRLARTVQMTRGVAKQPVLATLPQAAWISPRDTGRKTTSLAAWEDVTLTAEEMAVIIPIAEAVLDDADYNIWDEVVPLIGQEFGRLLDLAGIFGNGPFAAGDSIVEKAQTAGNVIRLGDAVEGRATPDLADYLNLVMGTVEADGFTPSGWMAPITQKAKLRGLRDADGQPVYLSSIRGDGATPTIYDEPIAWSANGGWDEDDDTGALFVTGDFTKAIVGVRQDVTMKVLTEATITDGSGNVVLSLAEQDMVALRMVFRVAFATANPVTPLASNAATRSPFGILAKALVVG